MASSPGSSHARVTESVVEEVTSKFSGAAGDGVGSGGTSRTVMTTVSVAEAEPSETVRVKV